MQTLNHDYINPSALDEFLTNPLFDTSAVLLQVFSCVLDIKKIQSILQQITEQKPNIHIIGATTSGNIVRSEIQDDGILLSFACFEQTHIQTHYYAKTDAESGKDAGKDACNDQVRCVIAFGDALSSTPHNFLEGFALSAPQIMVAGGNAGDQHHFQKTYLIQDNQLHDSGIVMAWLINPTLHCYNNFFLNWMPVGRSMIVTRAQGNILYELDGEPIVSVYKKYLGDEVFANIPNSIMEFPLLKRVDHMLIARCAVALSADNGIVYAGDLNQGESLTFGVADNQSLERHTQITAEKTTQSTPIESLFIYSCAARHVFLGDNINGEIRALSQLMPTTAGFFTYGEYFHTQTNNNHTFNSTTTFLALSESTTAYQQYPSYRAQMPKNSTLRSLVQLVNVTTRELKANAQLLEQYRIALDRASIVSKTDAKGNITYANARFEGISGYTQAEVLGKNHNILRHPDMPAQTFKDLWRTISHKEVWQGVITNRRKDGSSYTVNSFVVPILDDTGRITEYISIRNDITELLNKQKMIEQQKIDRLTNLPSRNALLMDIEKESLSMLAILDIRNFKLFNDFYGIDFADKIIIEVANWLDSFARVRHFKVYRVFGDRFAITFNKNSENSVSTQTVEQFKQTLQQLWTSIEEEHFDLNHESIDLDVVIGIGIGERHLLTLAEAAITQSKHNLKGKQIAVFDEQSAQQRDHLTWIHHIRNALNDGRIVNYYQPIVNPNNSDEIKYEALVRLVQKDGTVVSPFYFLDIAKKTRYYNQVTRSVFKQALAFSCQKKVQVSVNLSIEDIENKTLRDDILSQLAIHQTARITLEITESESIQDYAIMKQFVQDVHECGAQVAIDDFGSGYSNFSYLVEMQTDYLKIDGSIIKKILTDSNSLLVTESIIDIARKLGIKVVAEFVSDKAIADKLKLMGVDYLQGYYYGAPQAME